VPGSDIAATSQGKQAGAQQLTHSSRFARWHVLATAGHESHSFAWAMETPAPPFGRLRDFVNLITLSEIPHDAGPHVDDICQS